MADLGRAGRLWKKQRDGGQRQNHSSKPRTRECQLPDSRVVAVVLWFLLGKTEPVLEHLAESAVDISQRFDFLRAGRTRCKMRTAQLQLFVVQVIGKVSFDSGIEPLTVAHRRFLLLSRASLRRRRP